MMSHGGFCAAAWVTLAALSSAGAQPPVPTRVERDETASKRATVVLVAGTGSGRRGTHEYHAGARLLEGILKRRADLSLVVVRDGWPRNLEVFSGASTLVFFTDGGREHSWLRPERMSVLQKHVEAGRGLVLVHAALDLPDPQGQKLLEWMGGRYDPGTSLGSRPGWLAAFSTIPGHATTRGVVPFTLEDEWFLRLAVPARPGLTVVLQSNPPEHVAGGDPARPEIAAWALERPGGGRSFAISGGHHHASWGEENFRRLVANAIVWTAGLEVPAGGVCVELWKNALTDNLDQPSDRDSTHHSLPSAH
jgi:type 1 glutamine amidotransferase